VLNELFVEYAVPVSLKVGLVGLKLKLKLFLLLYWWLGDVVSSNFAPEVTITLVMGRGDCRDELLFRTNEGSLFVIILRGLKKEEFGLSF